VNPVNEKNVNSVCQASPLGDQH